MAQERGSKVFYCKNFLYYKVESIFFSYICRKFSERSHYKEDSYAEKPCHCRVSGKSEND